MSRTLQYRGTELFGHFVLDRKANAAEVRGGSSDEAKSDEKSEAKQVSGVRSWSVDDVNYMGSVIGGAM